MAIIICKKCGKKVSDTTDVCIHCGHPTHEEKSSDKEEKIKIEKNVYNFNSFAEDDKLILERDFLRADKWAMNYRTRKEEISSFLAMLAITLFCLVLALKIVGYVNKDFFAGEIYNESFAAIAISCLIALLALLLVISVYSVCMNINFKVTMARFIYMKKFQKWLKENKNIEYTPPFIKTKEKEIFEKINIDTL